MSNLKSIFNGNFTPPPVMPFKGNVNEIDRTRDALFYLDSGCARTEWVRYGMADKSAGLTFDDFHEWSATADNYKNERDCKSAWQSFKEDGGVTAAL